MQVGRKAGGETDMEKSRGWRLIFQKEKKIWVGGGQDPELLAMEGKPAREGNAKKILLGARYPSNVPSFTRTPCTRLDQKNLQGVPEGIVPPAFVGARDASRGNTL